MTPKSKSKSNNLLLIIVIVVVLIIAAYFVSLALKVNKELFHKSRSSSICPQGDDALINVDACRHSLYRYFDLMNLSFENASGVFYSEFNKTVPTWRTDPYFSSLLKTWHSVTPILINIGQKNQSAVTSGINTLLSNLTQLSSAQPTNPNLIKIISGSPALQMTITGINNITSDLLNSIPIVWT